MILGGPPGWACAACMYLRLKLSISRSCSFWVLLHVFSPLRMPSLQLSLYNKGKIARQKTFLILCPCRTIASPPLYGHIKQKKSLTSVMGRQLRLLEDKSFCQHFLHYSVITGIFIFILCLDVARRCEIALSRSAAHGFAVSKAVIHRRNVNHSFPPIWMLLKHKVALQLIWTMAHE